GLARGGAFTAAGKEAELNLLAAQAFLEGAANGRCYAGRVPVEAQDAAEGLEPVGMGQALEHLLGAVVMDDGGGDMTGELGPALEKPRRGGAAVEGQIGEAGAGWPVRHEKPCLVAAGAAAEGVAAGAGAASQRAVLALGHKAGNDARGLALALGAFGLISRLTHRTQQIELLVAGGAPIFVNGHLLPRLMAAGATAAAGRTGATAAADAAAFSHETGHEAFTLALALGAFGGGVGLAHRTQQFELLFAGGAPVFVDRHR